MARRAIAFVWIAMIQMATTAPRIAPCGYCPPRGHPGRAMPTVPVPVPPPGGPTCPIDGLKLGACVDALGGLAHVVVGDPAANQCCPALSGLLDLEAALCLCGEIKLKLLDLDKLLPLALQLLFSCGLDPPPGFTCPDS